MVESVVLTVVENNFAEALARMVPSAAGLDTVHRIADCAAHSIDLAAVGTAGCIDRPFFVCCERLSNFAARRICRRRDDGYDSVAIEKI